MERYDWDSCVVLHDVHKRGYLLSSQPLAHRLRRVIRIAMTRGW